MTGTEADALSASYAEGRRAGMTPTEKAVIAAAVKWWRGKRPEGWKLTEHLDSPLVNAYTSGGLPLAEAVSRLLRERGKK